MEKLKEIKEIEKIINIRQKNWYKIWKLGFLDFACTKYSMTVKIDVLKYMSIQRKTKFHFLI